jgi:hypothetical protein
VYRWRTDDDNKKDAAAAEAERLSEEGKQVSIGWGDGGRTIEHGPTAELSNKDDILATA